MLANRFFKWTVVFIVAAITLITLLSVNAYLDQSYDAQAISQGFNPDTYYPLPPGKQTILVNAAKQACLDQDYDIQTISQTTHPDTYYPLPPGKQTALVNAAIEACIDEQLGE